jgi:hypothetical protein
MIAMPLSVSMGSLPFERSFITAVVNTLAKAGIELGNNGSITAKAEGKTPLEETVSGQG